MKLRDGLSWDMDNNDKFSACRTIPLSRKLAAKLTGIITN
jgi:hypothetical protein